MTVEEFRAKWRAEAEAMQRRGGLVSGSVLIAEMLIDVETVLTEPLDALISVEEAARASGYSADHLARLVRDGKVPDRRPPGTQGRLLFRRGDLPVKPGRRHTPHADVHDLASRLYRGKEGRNGHSR
jgi:hypothetical protein